MRYLVHHLKVCSWPALLAILMLCPATSVEALVVGTSDPQPATNVDPDDYAVTHPDWTLGDPGWAHFTSAGHSGVYLGDGWVLTARHVGAPLGAQTITFQTPSGPQSFQSVPGQSFVVRNPPPPLSGGYNLVSLESGETDLRIYKINGTPNLLPLPIASRSDVVPNNPLVMTMGRGGTVRQDLLVDWYVKTHNSANPQPGGGGELANWVWTTTPPTSPDYYNTRFRSHITIGASEERRWGTNTLANLNDSVFNGVFDHAFSNTSGVVRVSTNDGKTRYVIAMPTLYQSIANGGTTLETLQMGGDSGGPVFLNFGTAEAPQWKLAGITNFMLPYKNQPGGTVIFGELNPNGTLKSDSGNSAYQTDLSYYTQAYQNSICDFMRTCGNYSIVGDVNVNGAISSDDINAFVAGWRSDNGAGKGDFVSWNKGDMTLDGKVDAADFFRMRQAFAAAGSGALFDEMVAAAQLGVSTVVPEPSTAALALLSIESLLALARRRPR